MGEMKEIFQLLNHPRATKVFLYISIFLFLFFLVAFVLLKGNVYEYPLLGAFYELLAFPAFSLLLIIPLLHVVQLIMRPSNFSWRMVLSFIMIAGAVYILTQVED